MSFIDLTDLGLESSVQTLANQAIAYLQDQIPGYVPSPGDLEVIQAEALAFINADLEHVALQVPSAIFRAFGTKLIGVPYLYGASATAQVTFTLADTFGHTIPSGTYLTLGDFGFVTTADLVVPSGSSTGTVTVAAVATGSAYNGAFTPAALVSPNELDWVQGVAVLAPASGGIDQEDDTGYQNRLATELSLQAPRPITASDYAKMALAFPPAAGTDQQEVGRATAIDGYNPASTNFTASTASGSSTLSSVSSFTGISAASGQNPGSIITGAGIPAGTTVVSVNTGAGTLVLSQAATATASGVALTSVGSYNNPRMVGVWITDIDGGALNADTLAAVAAWFQSYREVNFIVNVLSPTYTKVYASAQIHLMPGADPASVQAAVQQAIINFLSPPNWGVPPIGSRGSTISWFNYPKVHYNKLLQVIENVRGVDYVPVGGLTLGLAAAPTGTTSIWLPGPAPMPQSDTTSVPLPTVV